MNLHKRRGKCREKPDTGSKKEEKKGLTKPESFYYNDSEMINRLSYATLRTKIILLDTSENVEEESYVNGQKIHGRQ